MANQYLIEIHAYISQRIDEDRRLMAAALVSGDSGRTALLKGKLDQWIEIRTFLSSYVDLLTMKYY
ncbi:MAG: hypothetical protein HY911_10440 [Desulfobacterales bacterium]|nr:hypothetical protein [Desulfobacterales bacterium]